MARPTKLTPQVQKRIVAAVKLGATYELAAKAGGIHYDTFNEWRKANPEFSEALEKAEAEAAQKWLRHIEAAAAEGNWQAAAWKLERRYPQSYGRTVQEQQHSGEISIRISRYQPKEADGHDDRHADG